MEKEQNHSINNLIVNHLTGEITPDDAQRLTQWRAESDENEAYFVRYEKAYRLINKPADVKELNIDIDQEWNHFLEQIDHSQVISMPPRTGSNWLRIAAMISLVILGGAIINYFLTANDTILIQTAAQTKSISLPDGSMVELNRNSKLAYSENFGASNRELRLEGEGFFEVVSDPSKPFIISVNETSVEVLGTKFNVNGYDHTERIEVVVEEGLVQFSTATDEIQLSAGEKGVFSKASGDLRETLNNDLNFSSWKTGKIVFNNSDLQSVIATLNSVYGDRIVIASNISDSCEVTVSFDQQDLDSIMKVLEATLNLKIKTTGEKIEIVDAECN